MPVPGWAGPLPFRVVGRLQRYARAWPDRPGREDAPVLEGRVIDEQNFGRHPGPLDLPRQRHLRPHLNRFARRPHRPADRKYSRNDGVRFKPVDHPGGDRVSANPAHNAPGQSHPQVEEPETAPEQKAASAVLWAALHSG